MADARYGQEVGGPGRGRVSLLPMTEALLSVLAWAWTVLPRRTSRGYVTGKLLVGRVLVEGGDRSPAVARVLDVVHAGGGVGRARPARPRDLVREATDGLVRDSDIDGKPHASEPRVHVERFEVAPGLEVAAARMIRLRYRVMRWLLEPTGRFEAEHLVAEPVPRLVLSGSRRVPQGIVAGITWHSELQLCAQTLNQLSPESRRPRVLVLDTDVDEQALPTPVTYAKNFVVVGRFGDPANAAVNDPRHREPGTHGTLVAGIIGLLSSSARISVGRVAFADSGMAGGTDGEFVLRGLLAARRYDPPFDIVNVSVADDRPARDRWRGAFGFEMLREAVEDLTAIGTTVVAATGNHPAPDVRLDVGYPSRLEPVVAIGAVDWAGVASRFSRFGAMKPDLVAPGGQVDAVGDDVEWLGEFCGDRAVGTSFACAVASAVLAHAASPDEPPRWELTQQRALELARAVPRLLARSGTPTRT